VKDTNCDYSSDLVEQVSEYVYDLTTMSVPIGSPLWNWFNSRFLLGYGVLFGVLFEIFDYSSTRTLIPSFSFVKSGIYHFSRKPMAFLFGLNWATNIPSGGMSPVFLISMQRLCSIYIFNYDHGLGEHPTYTMLPNISFILFWKLGLVIRE